MKKEELRKLIDQVKKYDLVKHFESPEDFKSWALSLNDKQLQNFNNLTIEPSKIKDLLSDLLINFNLLNCSDYSQRVSAIMKLKNEEGCWYLCSNLCSPNFLNSAKFYKDIEKLGKAKTARYALRVINEDTFINSPYHDEDLTYILEARGDSVSEALAKVSKSDRSINGPHHRQDMKTIARTPNIGATQEGLSFLATNEESIKDPLHLENMELLSKNKEWYRIHCLCDIMGDQEIRKKGYSKLISEKLNGVEVEDENKFVMMYYYCMGKIDSNRRFELSHYVNDYNFEFIYYSDENEVRGVNQPQFIKNLELLSKVETSMVGYYADIMLKGNSEYQDFDLQLLSSVQNRKILNELHNLMIDRIFSISPYHKEDAKMISIEVDDYKREFLAYVAKNSVNVFSKNHRSDMNFISNLDTEFLMNNYEIRSNVEFLLCREGIDAENREEKLQLILSRQEPNSVLHYLDDFEQVKKILLMQKKQKKLSKLKNSIHK